MKGNLSIAKVARLPPALFLSRIHLILRQGQASLLIVRAHFELRLDPTRLSFPMSDHGTGEIRGQEN